MTLETIVGVDLVVQVRENKMGKKISIKNPINMVGLPLMTFYNNGRSLNFLIDSGSSMSLIDKNIVCDYIHEPLEEKNSIYGMDGIKSTCEKCKIYFTNDENKEFEETFIIQDMSTAFGYLQKEDNTKIHGILGTTFFVKYKYVIDFRNFQVYQTKMKQVIIMNLEANKVIITDLPKDNMSKEEVEKFITKYLKVESMDNIAYIAGFIDNYKL